MHSKQNADHVYDVVHERRRGRVGVGGGAGGGGGVGVEGDLQEEVGEGGLVEEFDALLADRKHQRLLHLDRRRARRVPRSALARRTRRGACMLRVR